MATRKLTEKQKNKLKDSEFIRSNSADVTVNPSFSDDIEYNEDDCTLSYDKRTRNGKEIERILNSRTRKPSHVEDDSEYEIEPVENIVEAISQAISECDDGFEHEEEDDDGVELPEIVSRYRGWDIWVDKDEVHKYVITAVLENDDEYEIDRIEINGDEIDEDSDVESIVTNEIDEHESSREEASDWNKNYSHYMGLDEDPDWSDSYDPD